MSSFVDTWKTDGPGNWQSQHASLLASFLTSNLTSTEKSPGRLDLWVALDNLAGLSILTSRGVVEGVESVDILPALDSVTRGRAIQIYLGTVSHDTLISSKPESEAGSELEGGTRQIQPWRLTLKKDYHRKTERSKRNRAFWIYICLLCIYAYILVLISFQRSFLPLSTGLTGYGLHAYCPLFYFCRNITLHFRFPAGNSVPVDQFAKNRSPSGLAL